MHICVTHTHTQAGVAERFVNDVRNASQDCLKDTTGPVQGKVSINNQGLVKFDLPVQN